MTDAQPITGCRPGDVAEHVFLCGDPARIEAITATWKNCHDVCNLREYLIRTGDLDGVRVSAASTGIGAPSTAILFEELATLGGRTFIRVGNSGGLAPGVEVGDLVVTAGAVRDDGTSRSYVTRDFPALAHYRVTAALVDAAHDHELRTHVGITWSLDAFYVGIGPEDLVPLAREYLTRERASVLLVSPQTDEADDPIEAGSPKEE